MTQIPRRTVIGKRDGVQPTDEAEHFFKCEACGGWFDTRDLGAVLGFDSYAGSSSRIWGLSCRREFNNDWRTLIFPLCSILPL
jgi:hypothetical protein